MKITSVRAASVCDADLLLDAAETLAVRRLLRVPLLEAFDVYKSNVAYGILEETEKEHKDVAKWYRLLLDLDPVAFREVPPRIAAYVREGVTA